MTYSRIKFLYFLLIKMRYSFTQVILFIFVFSALYSCVSLKKISIQVAVQPEYPIDEDIQSMVLLNRSMNSQFTNTKADSLEKILINQKMLLDSVFQDSIAADTVIQVVAKSLFESGRFDVIIPKELNVVRTDSATIAEPLNVDFINEICKDFNVNAVLVLEGFAEQLNTKYYLTKIQGVASEVAEYSGATDVNYSSEWRLYRPNNLKPVIRFQIGDTIFWKAYSYDLDDLYSQMPKTKSALIGGGIEAGLKMSGYISPNWVDQTRYYYLTGNKEIDVVVSLIQNNKWEEAAAIWTKYTAIPSKTIRSKVEYNLALASEMNGDIDLAIEWGLKSYKTRYSKATEVYLKTLDNKRIAQLKESKKKY